jgi:hypothetical protein
MQRLIASGVLVMVVYAVTLIVGTAIAAPNAFTGLAQYFSPQYISELYGGITGNWQDMGQLFTQLQSTLFWKVFLGLSP